MNAPPQEIEPTQLQPAAGDNFLQEITPLTRRALSQNIGESALHFIEVIRDIPRPEPNVSDDIEWEGLSELVFETAQERLNPSKKYNHKDPLSALTDRQLETAELVVKKCKTFNEVAEELGISVAAVKKRMIGAYSRLDINSREELAELMPVDRQDHKDISLTALNSLNISQAECLGRVALSQANESIAEALSLSTSLIEKKLRETYALLGLRHRFEAFRAATLLKTMVEEKIILVCGTRFENLVKLEIEKNTVPPGLSPRQLEMVNLRAQGMTYRETAAEMGISERGVVEHRVRMKKAAEPALKDYQYMLEKMRLHGDSEGDYGFHALTPRERAIFAIAQHGRVTKQQVAKTLKLSINRVDNHLLSACKKLGQKNVASASIVYAYLLAEERQNSTDIDGVPTWVLGDLSLDEWQITKKYFIQGLTRKEIEEELKLGSDILSGRIRIIYAKLGAADKIQANVRLCQLKNNDDQLTDISILDGLSSLQKETLEILSSGVSRRDACEMLGISNQALTLRLFKISRLMRTGPVFKIPAIYKRLKSAQSKNPAYSRSPEEGRSLLSPRQSEVLDLVAEGQDYQSIADKLGISERTVRNYASTINERLGVRAISQAVSIVYRDEPEAPDVLEEISLDQLAPLEREVLELLTSGASCDQIKKALNTQQSIYKILEHAYDVLGVNKRGAAVKRFLGLVNAESEARGRVAAEVMNAIERNVVVVLQKLERAGMICDAELVNTGNHEHLASVLYKEGLISKEQYDCGYINLNDVVIAFLLMMKGSNNLFTNENQSLVQELVAQEVNQYFK